MVDAFTSPADPTSGNRTFAEVHQHITLLENERNQALIAAHRAAHENAELRHKFEALQCEMSGIRLAAAALPPSPAPLRTQQATRERYMEALQHRMETLCHERDNAKLAKVTFDDANSKIETQGSALWAERGMLLNRLNRAAGG